MTLSIGTSEYESWVTQFDTLTAEDRTAAQVFARSLDFQPSIDVVMPVHDPPERFLEEAIRSVREQFYQKWTLFLYDDCSTQPHVQRVLQRAALDDERIRTMRGSQNLGIAGARNAGLALGSSPFVFFLDHDDYIEPHALLLFAHALNEAPDANLVYCDGDILTEEGRRDNPFFKPDFDHQLLLSIPLAWGLFRRSLLDTLGGMRLHYPGSEDYEIVLRATEHVREDTIRHVPHILGHWRMVKSSFAHNRLGTALESAQRAVHDHCVRIGMDVELLTTPRTPFRKRVRPVPKDPPSVTVVVEGATGELGGEQKIESLTLYPRIRFARGSSQVGARSTVERRNEQVRRDSSELVVFLDARLTPREPDWLTELVAQFVVPRCAAAGARIVGADGRVEQNGLLLGVREGPGKFPVARIMKGSRENDPGYFGRADLPCRASVVGGGMLIARRDALLKLGGFDEGLGDPLFADVDFSLRARAQGWVLVTCPSAVFDAADEAPYFDDDHSRRTLEQRWGATLETDPYYNPNLANFSPPFRLAFPPRVQFPWKQG